MTFKPFFILLAAMAHMCALPFLRAGDLEADFAKNAALFDGVAKRPPKAAPPPPAAEDKERLTTEFKKRLTIDDHGSSEERAALDSMISKMMESATAREVVAKFIKEDAKAKLSLKEIAGSIVVTVGGNKTFWGPLGMTDHSENPPAVELNKLLMQYDRDLAPGTLAHELLGHAFERQRAGETLKIVQYYNTNEEENARLIGWLVNAELKVKTGDDTWAYMQNPEENIQAIKMMHPAYAIGLTTEEMKDPVPVYERLIADADKRSGLLRQKSKEYAGWSKVIDHFVNSHKMDPASFQAIRDDISNTLESIPAEQQTLETITATLRKYIASFSSAEGKMFLEKLAKESDSDYFNRKDAVIKERRKRLEGLLLTRTPNTSSPPPPVGQLTWQQFKELRETDKDSCPFGGIE